jgi:hypothetical protein
MKRKVKPLEAAAAGPYFAKAMEFAGAMRNSLATGQWDVAGLNAVHAVISAADALLSIYGGVRSAESDHRIASRLLEEVLGDASAGACRHIAFVIAKKNVIEYEQRRLVEKEAREIAEHAERFLRFADAMLGRAK